METGSGGQLTVTDSPCLASEYTTDRFEDIGHTGGICRAQLTAGRQQDG